MSDPSNTDLTTQQGGLVVVTDAGSIFAKAIELASNPNTNPEMYDRIVAWQEREQDRQAQRAYNIAMNAAQAEIQPVARRAENKQTNSFYAKLEDVDEAIRPVYLKHGFSLSYNAVAPLVPGNIRIECTCAHSDHKEKFYREAPADTLGPKGTSVKTALHGGGSTETYLKRYIACGIFNVVFKNQDDDGNRGGMKFISSDQAGELHDLIVQAGFEETEWLQRRAGNAIRSVDEVEQQSFVILSNMLRQVIAQRATKKE
jgi:hypothetical protein